MIRRLTALAALLAVLALGAARAADDKDKGKTKADEDTKGKLVIRWHGQSFFEIISTKGTRIVLDPHAIEEFGRVTVQADLVLMSHLHDDHTQVGVISNIKKAKQYNGLKVVDKRQEWNLVNDKFKDVKFYNIATFHDPLFGMKRGKNTIWVMEVDGLRIAHLGDLGHLLNATQLKKLGAVDVLMVPIGGIYTLNGLDAMKVVEQINPKRYVLPMHYGIDNESPLLTIKASQFLDELDKSRIKRLDEKDPSNTLLIDPKEPAAKEWSVLVLDYKNAEKKEK
jgi:L-ascorbate metabolism protein UlaG (beta-lactamase superfamily)